MTVDAPKAKRRQLAKSELLVYAAGWAQNHADDIAGRPRYPGDHPCRPFEEWGDDDPFVRLTRVYSLTKQDVERLLIDIADEFERRAERAGYDEAWR